MKKYAALRLYYAPDKYQGQSVVTLNEQGEVLSFFSLDEETHTTEWVGGIIILSSKATISIEENYNDLLTEEHYTANTPIYAWHLFPFDFKNECPTPNSLLKKLN